MRSNLTEQSANRFQCAGLAVPGSHPGMMEKASKSAADAVFLDLEDGVAPDQKDYGRDNIIQALNELDWGERTILVRINATDSPWMYRDVIEVVEKCPRLDMIMIPKVGVPGDVYAIDMLLTQIEKAKKRERRIGIEAMIETALGMANVEAIAQSSQRLEAMTFAAGDYAASTHARVTDVGAQSRDYALLTDPDEEGKRHHVPLDLWHYAQARVVMACRAYGLRPNDGPYANFKDPEGWLVAGRRAAALGFESKWAIHPAQLDLAWQVFTPSDAEVEQAQRVLEAMAQAAGEGRGAAALDGRMIDWVNISMAQNVITKAERAKKRRGLI